MENKSIHCTLTDAELTAKADKWIYDLCHGASWIMHVPARPNEDPDMILSELNNRFKERLKAQPGPRWVKASTWPQDHNIAHWRRVEDKKPLLVVGRNYQDNIIAQFGRVYTPNELEWLDEQPAAGREEDAVAFHDWVLENEWEINYREQRTHTTAELYELFKQQKEK